MTISKNFEHQNAENKWYQHWQNAGFFYSTPDDRPAYTIVMPPPNVTGVLHMGHALNNTIQDILIRRAKMQGFNTCWVPGTDHASIATEAKVVNMLKEKGIDKKTLSREDFLKYAWEWKEEYGGIILEQLKKLGCSLDWNRVHFTLDDAYYKSVINVFNDLYKKGFIYRGAKMINWDPQAKTALSDEEVNFKETNSKLTYIKYQISGFDEFITIATVRPETILGDTAICVHPEDNRYSHLKGKKAIVPLINREIPIIFDDYIDIEFGTGALKVTPAHDINDYNLGQKHQLQVIDILNDDGTLSEAAQLYIGEDRFAVRKKIITDLEASGNLVKQEEYKNQVGYSERTNVAIEPKISMQWWCNMEKMATPALSAVMEDYIKFFPPKFKNLYRHWLTNIKDWCISRQLWWGQRIPAWYDAENNIYVAQNIEGAIEQYCQKKQIPIISIEEGKKILCQDEDVLDTWFSSWLWPMEVFGWDANPNNNEISYYYPTNTLVTGPDIIFFWVARMVMAGYEYRNEKPFQQVYFTGIVRDKQGRKMSKQLGNSPDLLQLIEQHGADVVRFSVLISSPAGNDILFDEAFLEQGRNFSNKMWNAMKLIKMWEDRIDESTPNEDSFAINWMKNRISEVNREVEQLMNEFKLSEALKTIYSLIWDDFCSWYLEWVKPGFEQKINKNIFEESIFIFEQLLQLIHPFMPFVSEEIYQTLKSRIADDALMVKQLVTTEGNNINQPILNYGKRLKEMITAIRDARVKNNLKPKDDIQLCILTSDAEFYKATMPILLKQSNASNLELVNEAPKGSIAIAVDTEKICIITQNGIIDTSAQKAQLEKDLAYQKGFLLSVEKKLSNERFVQNAKPEILAAEQKKLADATAKIKTIEESLHLL
jgi:valyl-tRNA synthetase